MAEPSVLTVIPVLNEELHLDRCLRSIRSQTLTRDQHRVLVLDGGSTDSTREIVLQHVRESMSGEGPVVELLDNPGVHVPHARNLALKKVDGESHMFEIIGHAWVPPEHLENRLADLQEAEEEIGRSIGSMGTRIIPEVTGGSWEEASIEALLSSPLGGSGQFARFKGRSVAESPAFCLHRVEAIQDVNGWDERWVVGQDRDLNLRIAKAGWLVMRSDASYLHMAKRRSFSSLWGMGHRYGYWRARQASVSVSRLRVREFLPWFGFLAVICGFALSSEVDGSIYLSLYLVTSYASVALLVGLLEAVRFRHISLILGVPLGLVILHISFSLGLLRGGLKQPPPANERVKSANH
ncbi:MAG TPA: glycosyltransferase [Candidatus Thalassarchaeaceae archaeon]|nr:MAG TPA: glycosyltransferase [Candidatus Poseidoniales archaeon]HIH84149.1 glycosyltransferase [Candidatus Thalassarchaeaceae archaeon]